MINFNISNIPNPFFHLKIFYNILIVTLIIVSRIYYPLPYMTKCGNCFLIFTEATYTKHHASVIMTQIPYYEHKPYYI